MCQKALRVSGWREPSGVLWGHFLRWGRWGEAGLEEKPRLPAADSARVTSHTHRLPLLVSGLLPAWPHGLIKASHRIHQLASLKPFNGLTSHCRINPVSTNPAPTFFFFFFKKSPTPMSAGGLIYLWLCWVFIALCGLSLVAATRGYCPLKCWGFSSPCSGFSGRGARALACGL